MFTEGHQPQQQKQSGLKKLLPDTENDKRSLVGLSITLHKISVVVSCPPAVPAGSGGDKHTA